MPYINYTKKINNLYFFDKKRTIGKQNSYERIRLYAIN